MISSLTTFLAQTGSRRRELLAIGFVTVLFYNWRLWRRDQALATRLRQERAVTPELKREPHVSALVAAWNEGERIEAHLRSFEQLSYPHIELILCAGGGDDTLARARRHAGPRVVVLEQRAGEGKQRALARCLEQASGEVVYLTDADCIFSDEALARLLDPLVNDGELVTTGTSRPLDEQSGKLLPTYLWAADVASSAQRPRYVEGILGRNAAVHRRALCRIGGLNFMARTGTDYQLARRLLSSGVAIRHVPESVVPSEYPETLGVYRRKQSRWLRNLLIHGPRYGARRDVRATLTTIAIGAAMMSAPLAVPIAGRGLLVTWLLLLTHAICAKLRYVLFAARLYAQPAPCWLLISLPPLTLIDFAVWALPILDLLHPRRRHQW